MSSDQFLLRVGPVAEVNAQRHWQSSVEKLCWEASAIGWLSCFSQGPIRIQWTPPIQWDHRVFPGMYGKEILHSQGCSKVFCIQWADLNSNILLPPRGRKEHAVTDSEWPVPLLGTHRSWTALRSASPAPVLWETMFKSLKDRAVEVVGAVRLLTVTSHTELLSYSASLGFVAGKVR